MALVEAEDLSAYLTKQGAPASSLRVAGVAAATASAFVEAFCSRLRPVDPAPRVVQVVALHLAARIASNPLNLRAVSAEGQSVGLPVVGLTYFESVLLSPYRRRSA